MAANPDVAILRSLFTRAGTTAEDPDLLRNIDATLPRGAVYFVYGQEAAGKSALCDCLVGYGVGEAKKFVVVDRVRIGYVPQRLDQFPAHITAEEFCMCLGALRNMKDSDIIHNIQVLSDVLALGALLHRPLASLTPSQRAAVAIASALIGSPDLLILDNSIACLDPRLGQKFENFLTTLARDHHMCVLMISHSLSTALRADVIAVMHRGMLLLEESPRQIIEAWKDEASESSVNPSDDTPIVIHREARQNDLLEIMTEKNLELSLHNVVAKFERINRLGGGEDVSLLAKISYRLAFECSQWQTLLSPSLLPHPHPLLDENDVDALPLIASSPPLPSATTTPAATATATGTATATATTAAIGLQQLPPSHTQKVPLARELRKPLAPLLSSGMRFSAVARVARLQFKEGGGWPMMIWMLLFVVLEMVLFFFFIGSDIENVRVGYISHDSSILAEQLKHNFQNLHSYQMIRLTDHGYSDKAQLLNQGEGVAAAIVFGKYFSQKIIDGSVLREEDFAVYVNRGRYPVLTSTIHHDLRLAIHQLRVEKAPVPPLDPFAFVTPSSPPPLLPNTLALSIPAAFAPIHALLLSATFAWPTGAISRLREASLSASEWVTVEMMVAVKGMLFMQAVAVLVGVVLGPFPNSAIPLQHGIVPILSFLMIQATTHSLLVIACSAVCTAFKSFTLLSPQHLSNFLPPHTHCQPFAFALVGVILPLFIVSGAMWPIEAQPNWLQLFTRHIPTTTGVACATASASPVSQLHAILGRHVLVCCVWAVAMCGAAWFRVRSQMNSIKA